MGGTRRRERYKIRALKPGRGFLAWNMHLLRIYRRVTLELIGGASSKGDFHIVFDRGNEWLEAELRIEGGL